MPFTGAHPALILPLLYLRKRWLSATGLIVGSIAPDMAYFIPYRSFGSLSHSLKGLLLFNLPVSLLLAIIFHLLIRDQVIQNLPSYFRKRALAVKPLNFLWYLTKHGHIFAFAALIGSFSHLLWDSFTHYNGYFVRNYSILLRPVSIGFMELPLCRLLQHISTAVGLTLILWYINGLATVQVTNKPMLRRLYYWVQVLFAGAVSLLINLPKRLRIDSLESIVVPFLSGVMIAIIGLAIIYKIQCYFRKEQ
jgi:hypothetical protein